MHQYSIDIALPADVNPDVILSVDSIARQVLGEWKESASDHGIMGLRISWDVSASEQQQAENVVSTIEDRIRKLIAEAIPSQSGQRRPIVSVAEGVAIWPGESCAGGVPHFSDSAEDWPELTNRRVTNGPPHDGWW